MDEVRVEPLGGVVGYGAPGLSVKSEGKLAWSSLSAEDQNRLLTLFKKPPAGLPGNLRYRLTRTSRGGVESVEVGPQDVPVALLNSVTTRFDD